MFVNSSQQSYRKNRSLSEVLFTPAGYSNKKSAFAVEVAFVSYKMLFVKNVEYKVQLKAVFTVQVN